MQDASALTPDRIREIRQQKSTMRSRDLADSLGIAEAMVVAAEIGHGVTQIDATPDALMPLIPAMGEVMALTRNENAVIEKTGPVTGYTPDTATVQGQGFELRLTPRHWIHGFAVEEQKGKHLRRSIQVYDAAGDAVHKIYIGEDATDADWAGLVDSLRTEDQGRVLPLTPRHPVAPPHADPDQREALRAAWDRLGGRSTFQGMLQDLGMSRLAAYRAAGAPHARPLSTDCIGTLLDGLADRALPFTLLVGNPGCTEIHTGPAETIKPTGPWQNILDPAFNLHLRADRVAELWAVTKPGQHGPALSVEAFDAGGELIAQFFGLRGGGAENAAQWADLVDSLPAA
ncbi:hemin-degrading factor [Rhodovulum adriaticum]|uniref:Putative hemin transport protein n=1 Tax=Rhodovulum adriaticum TaxID=35804 RepID=A0A4R2NN67_RHOAD|nr:ChuX/HutX family heme-like substrate-binding protein [Rhodovulum adriaticum]MBK1634533.1 hypothetical protein [Rhodovulum adriaticum]TCP23097.1 putative hemin transport protein [Rhodovulum adriaticum]